MTSALSSPNLGSASLLEWTAGPASPEVGTPRIGQKQIIQKQVVRVKGMTSEALVVMYLRLAVPISATTQTFQLFPDEGITLKSSQMHAVNLSKEGRAVIPHDANRHLQRAAEILGITRATPVTFSSLKENQDTQGSSSRTRKAKVTTGNFHVSFVVPPDSDRLTSQKGDERCHYVAIVQLTVPLILTPPKWPYMVRIPLARCLNNYLDFSVDESCGQAFTTVEVDPPLLPKPTPMIGTKTKSNTDIEANGEADEDQALSGPFYSTPSLSIRWASADAGLHKVDQQGLESGHRLVRAQVLRVAAVFSQFKRINDNVAEVSVQAQLTLKGIHYPGLDLTANVNLQLEAPSGSCWKPETVSIIPTKQSASCFRSLSAIHPASTSVHSLKPGSRLQSRAEQIRSPSPLSSSSSSSDGGLDVDATLDDEGNLLDVRPPKEITSSDLFSSSESDGDEGNTTGTFTSKSSKNRRYSLGQRQPDGKQPHLDSSAASAPLGSKKTIYIVLSVSALCQGMEEFSCSLEAVVQLPIHHQHSTTADVMKLTLPLIKAHGIALEYDATVLGATYQASSLGKDVKRNGLDAKRHLALSASASAAEIHDTRLEVLVEEGAIGGSVTTVDKHEPSQDVSEDSDTSFANRSFQGKHGQGQTAQIDSLSGMIQEASVEVYSSVVLQEHLLLIGGAKKKIKTTHVIRSSWPSAPAPSSDLCGALLPQIVFALPCSDESELQILCASINGHSVHIEENAASSTKRSSSRIVDLQLPDSLKGTQKVDVFLLYMQESSDTSSLCLFPPVASSIADLSVSLHYGAFDSQVPVLSFSNQPVNLYEYKLEEGMHKMETRAHMVPSMTSVTAGILAKVKPVILSVTADVARLRRSNAGRGRIGRHRFSLLTIGSLFYVMCSVIMAVFLTSTLYTLDPIVDRLSQRVNILALALNVDFTEGYWKPEPKPEVEPVPITISQPVSGAALNGEGDIRPGTTNHKAETDESGEPHELSVDTTSFALLMQSISLSLTRTISWPLRFFFGIFGRSSTSSRGVL